MNSDSPPWQWCPCPTYTAAKSALRWIGNIPPRPDVMLMLREEGQAREIFVGFLV
ncbi:hypothetical protein C4J86_4660 [Pseudomonas sp. R2-7-07]|nr:hypothetical protein C4J86_4660 [Pseudomonas sp. R2-7-07]